MTIFGFQDIVTHGAIPPTNETHLYFMERSATEYFSLYSMFMNYTGGYCGRQSIVVNDVLIYHALHFHPTPDDASKVDSGFSSANVWYHAAITMSSTGVKALYINGLACN